MRVLRLPLLAPACVLAVLLAGGGIAHAAPAGSDLAGTWLPADGQGGGRAYAALAADGTWTASDGCNTTKGTWSAGPDGEFAATSGSSTKIGCENVPIASWLDDATRAEVDGDTLVLSTATGAETGRLVAR